jgi:pimeloyl-ACP methyl ester carboxylesterase
MRARKQFRHNSLPAARAAIDLKGLIRGYWISNSIYFHVAELKPNSRGPLYYIPRTFNAETNVLVDLLSNAETAKLADQCGADNDEYRSLMPSDYDMPDVDHLAVSFKRADCLVDLRTRIWTIECRRGPPTLCSLDGNWRCFVEQNRLVCEHHGDSSRVTYDAQLPHRRAGVSPGAADSEGGSPVGVWSEDSRWFLSHWVDETSIPEDIVVDAAVEAGKRPRYLKRRRATPIDPLPCGRLIIFDTMQRKWREVERTIPFSDHSPFAASRFWFADPDIAYVILYSRDFKSVELCRIDVATATLSSLMSETADTGYIELNQAVMSPPNVWPLPCGEAVIWYSERDGTGRLYLYNPDNSISRALTPSHLLVRDIIAVDTCRNQIVYTASKVSELPGNAARRVFRTSLSGETTCLVDLGGDISAPADHPAGFDHAHRYCPRYCNRTLSSDGSFIALRTTSEGLGNRTFVVDLRNSTCTTLAAGTRARDNSVPVEACLEYEGRPLTCYGKLLLPSGKHESPIPLVDYIYPGPQIANRPVFQHCHKSYFAEALNELGFAVLFLDTPGVPYGPKPIRQAGYGSLLEPQVSLHAKVVEQLCVQHDFLSRQQLAILGESAGGAAAYYAVLRYADLYRCAIAVAGCYDPLAYCSFWVDKFCGLDRERVRRTHYPDLGSLTARLLLVVGEQDENVDPSQTMKLANELASLGKPFSLHIEPGASHNVLFASPNAHWVIEQFLCRSFDRDYKIHKTPHRLSAKELSEIIYLQNLSDCW